MEVLYKLCHAWDVVSTVEFGGLNVFGVGCGWEFGRKDTFQSQAPVTSIHPWRSTSLVGISNVTASLSYITEQPLSHRVPMPMRLLLKVGMM